MVLQRRLPEYRLAMFEELHRLLRAEGVQLHVVHGQGTSREVARHDEALLPWAVRVRSHAYSVGRTLLSYLRVPIGLIWRQDLVVLPHESGFLANYLILGLRLLGGPRVAFWGHGAAPRSFRSDPRGWFRASTTKLADWWFAYTKLSTERVVATGFPAERITCLNNSIAPALSSSRGQATPSAEAPGAVPRAGRLRPVGLFLGSLTAEKRLDFLVEAADQIRCRIPDFELVIIGDGPMRPALEQAAASRPWFRLEGAAHGIEKAKLAASARAMLSPGMVGLNIVDSFALGVPLVATDFPGHSPEISYLEHGQNGLFAANSVPAFAETTIQVLLDDALHAHLVEGCQRAARTYTLEAMARNFATGLLAALAPQMAASPGSDHSDRRPVVAVLWRSFLPYHLARLRQTAELLGTLGYRVVGVEVADRDAAYRPGPVIADGSERLCLFPATLYQALSPLQIRRRVMECLAALAPDLTLAPATPFPEGMAAILHRNRTGSRVVLMDDAWERTDPRGTLTRMVKRLIHQSVDGMLIPSQRHAPYFRRLGMGEERLILGVNAVDNARIGAVAAAARRNALETRSRLGLPDRYLLFLGRFLARKGLHTLLTAYRKAWPEGGGASGLVLAGAALQDLPSDLQLPLEATCLGPLAGDDVFSTIALADALVVPSSHDQWALVVNEGMAAGVPVIVSDGCGAATLVNHGENGFCFPSGDAAALSVLLATLVAATPAERAAIGQAAQRTISAWGLESFAFGVEQALRLPRRVHPRLLSVLACAAWTGRVRTY
jgi:L-malate glycosyltransferase